MFKWLAVLITFFRRLFSGPPPVGPKLDDASATLPDAAEPPAAASVDEDAFWAAIAVAGAELAPNFDEKGTFERLQRHCASLDAEVIRSLQQTHATLFASANTRELWGVAFLAVGGCSDDAFMDFRDWLICQGRDVFEEALENPDSLAPLVAQCRESDHLPFFEGIFGAFRERYEAITGLDHIPGITRFGGIEPRGEVWTKDDLQHLLPRVWAVVHDETPAPLLADLIVETTGQTRKVALAWAAGLSAAVIDLMTDQKRQLWPGFGSFSVKRRAARRVANGYTQEQVCVLFKLDAKLQDEWNQEGGPTTPSIPPEFATQFSEGDDAEAWAGVFASWRAGLETHPQIEVPRLGRFSLKVRAARLGRDPRTGAQTMIPPRRSVSFEAHRPLLSVVR